MTRPLAFVPGALVTAAADGSPDPFLAACVAQYLARYRAEHAHTAAVRSGAIAPAPVDRWLISDRD